jgi:Tfp pilus assembly protein PilF
LLNLNSVWPFAVIGTLLLTGCDRSPKAREAKFLKRAETLVAAKDFARASLELKNASAAMPGDPEPYYRQGLIELQTQNPWRAVAEFRKALELNPNHQGAKLKLAEIMALSAKKEDVQEAAQRLTQIIQESPNAVEASDSLAFTQWRLGKPEDAAKLLEETLAKFPSRLESSMGLARVKLAQKDFAGAEEVLKAAVKNAPTSSPAALALGRFYLLAGKLDEAEAQMKTALQLDSNNGPALASLAAIQLHAGRKQEAEQSYQRLSALPDKSFRPVHALFLFQEGKRDEAIVEFERLAKADPQDREARGRLVAAYVETNQKPKAEKLLNDALHRNANDVDALLQRSSFYLSAGNTAEAEKDLQHVLHLRSDSVEAHSAMSNLYHQTGETELERQELNQVLQLNPLALPARARLARSYTLAGKASAALDIVKGAPVSQRRAVPLLLERNWALYALGRTEELKVAIAEGEAVSSSPEWLLQSALLKLTEGAYAEARMDAEEFLKRQPEDSRGARLIAQIYLSQKQPQAAIDRVREIASQHPQAAGLQQLYGDLLAGTGNRAAARGAYQAAKTANPASIQADLKLAELDLTDGNLASAQQISAAALEREPRSTRARLILANIAQSTHHDADAISDYRRVLDLEPDNVLALNNLAYMLALTNPDEALPYAQKALEIAPGSATVQDTIGWIYCRKGIYNTALSYLKASVEHEPTPRRQFHLAIAQLKSGDRQRGQALLNEAMNKDPNLGKEPLW